MDAATEGRNTEEVDLAMALDPDILRRNLTDQFAAKIGRKDELLAGFTRFETKIGAHGIADKETLDRAAEFEKQIRDEVKDIEAARERVKRPVNEAASVIQGFFKSMWSDPLLKAADAIRQHRTAYLREIERKAREAALAEAERQRKEAERLAQEAERTRSAEAMSRAIAADEAAADAEVAAAAKPADLTRSRSDLGVTSSLRRTLAFRVVDKALVPVAFMQVVDSIVMATGRAEKDPITSQPVPGIVYFWDTKAR